MQERRAFYVVFLIAAVLVVSAALALRTVIHPVILHGPACRSKQFLFGSP